MISKVIAGTLVATAVFSNAVFFPQVCWMKVFKSASLQFHQRLTDSIIFSFQFQTVADVPSSYFQENRFIFGKVVRFV